MAETIPVYTKGTDKVLQAEPAPANQVVQINMPDIAPPKALPKGDAKASAKSAKVMNKNEIDDSAIALRKEKNRARRAKYCAANPEKVKAYKAEYYAANREKISAHKAKYYADNSEKRKAYAAKYQAANREKIKAYQAAYHAAKKAEAAAAITITITRDNHG